MHSSHIYPAIVMLKFNAKWKQNIIAQIIIYKHKPFMHDFQAYTYSIKKCKIFRYLMIKIFDDQTLCTCM